MTTIETMQALFEAVQNAKPMMQTLGNALSDAQAVLKEQYDAGYAQGLVDGKPIDGTTEPGSEPAPAGITQEQLDAAVAAAVEAAKAEVLAEVDAKVKAAEEAAATVDARVLAVKEAAKLLVDKVALADAEEAQKAKGEIDAL